MKKKIKDLTILDVWSFCTKHRSSCKDCPFCVGNPDKANCCLFHYKNYYKLDHKYDLEKEVEVDESDTR